MHYISHMRTHGFRSLSHPLSQIQAAETVFVNAMAFVRDEWADIYKDPPPDEEEVYEWLSPFELLGNLSGCELRFELAGSGSPFDEYLEGYWTRRFTGSVQDILFYSWMSELESNLGIDPRIISHGFLYTDFVLIPDPERVVATAYDLVIRSMGLASEVTKRVLDKEKQEQRNFRRLNDARFNKASRGEGPRSTNLVLADRAAVVLRDAQRPLTADDVAKAIGVSNVASVNTTLYQMSVNRRPKRLAGWVRHLGDGRYAWAAGTDQNN